LSEASLLSLHFQQFAELFVALGVNRFWQSDSPACLGFRSTSS